MGCRTSLNGLNNYNNILIRILLNFGVLGVNSRGQDQIFKVFKISFNHFFQCESLLTLLEIFSVIERNVMNMVNLNWFSDFWRRNNCTDILWNIVIFLTKKLSNDFLVQPVQYR